jgi:hypothetical protein
MKTNTTTLKDTTNGTYFDMKDKEKIERLKDLIDDLFTETFEEKNKEFEEILELLSQVVGSHTDKYVRQIGHKCIRWLREKRIKYE